MKYKKNYFARNTLEDQEMSAAISGLPPGPLLDAIALVKVEIKKMRKADAEIRHIMAALDVLSRMVRSHLAGQQHQSFEDIDELLTSLQEKRQD